MCNKKSESKDGISENVPVFKSQVNDFHSVRGFQTILVSSTVTKKKYGHPLLIARAAIAAMNNLPYIRTGDPQSLDRFAGGLNGLILGLIGAGLNQEITAL